MWACSQVNARERWYRLLNTTRKRSLLTRLRCRSVLGNVFIPSFPRTDPFELEARIELVNTPRLLFPPRRWKATSNPHRKRAGSAESALTEAKRRHTCPLGLLPVPNRTALRQVLYLVAQQVTISQSPPRPAPLQARSTPDLSRPAPVSQTI